MIYNVSHKGMISFYCIQKQNTKYFVIVINTCIACYKIVKEVFQIF